MSLQPGSGSRSKIDQRHRDRIDIYYADAQANVRVTIRSTMSQQGFREIREFSRTPDLRDALMAHSPDVLILDYDLPEAPAWELVTQLRAGNVCDNPFVPIIFTLWEPSQESVRRIVNSGADDMLVKPIAPGFLIQRIEVLAYSRKPFVVTSDYVGPDRRKDPNRGSEIPLIEVPNTLEMKAKGEAIDRAALTQAINSAAGDIHAERLRRGAYQVGFLVGLILDTYEGRSEDEHLPRHLIGLGRTAKDMLDRIPKSTFGEQEETVKELSSLSRQLYEAKGQPSASQIQELKEVSSGILEGFNPDKSAHELAVEVAHNIKNYKARMAEQ